MQELTYEQKNIILDNFGRRCPGITKDGEKCGQVMQPLSTMCRNCGTSTPFKKIAASNYIEHFEIKLCDIANDRGFWYCIHPKIDSKLEELQQYCIHCITVDLVKTNVQILKSQDQ